MKCFVLLAIFLTAQGITGYPWHPLWHDSFEDDPADYSDDLELVESEEKISLDSKINTEIESPVHEDFPKVANISNPSIVNTDTLDDKSVSTLPLLDKIYHQLNKTLHSLREFEAAVIAKDLITKNQSTPVNTASNDRMREYVINFFLSDKHIALMNDKFTLIFGNKKLPEENNKEEKEKLEDNKEEKEKLEDNKEKLEDNKNLASSESSTSESSISESSISESTASMFEKKLN